MNRRNFLKLSISIPLASLADSVVLEQHPALAEPIKKAVDALYSESAGLHVALFSSFGEKLAEQPIEFRVSEGHATNLNDIDFDIKHATNISRFSIVTKSGEELIEGPLEHIIRAIPGDSVKFNPGCVSITTT